MAGKRHNLGERYEYARRAALYNDVAGVASEAKVEPETVQQWMREFQVIYIPPNETSQTSQQAAVQSAVATQDQTLAADPTQSAVEAAAADFAEYALERMEIYDGINDFVLDNITATDAMWETIEAAGDADNPESKYMQALQSDIRDWAEEVTEFAYGHDQPELPEGTDASGLSTDWDELQNTAVKEATIERLVAIRMADLRGEERPQ